MGSGARQSSSPPGGAAGSSRSLATGGRFCEAGLTTQDDKGQVSIPIDQLVLNEWSLVGSLGNPHSDYPELLHLVDSGKLAPSKIIGEEVALDEVQTVFDRLPAFETEGFTIITNLD